MSRYFKCETNKSPISYKCGEKIIFTISAKENGNPIPCKYVSWTIEGDDGKKTRGLGSIGSEKPLVLETVLDRPGFVHLVCNALNDFDVIDASIDTLDSGAGAEIEKLEYCDTVPEDFDDYWREIEQQVANFPVEVLECNELKDGVPKGFKVFDVRIKTPEGRPASGIVTMPEKQGKYPLRIQFNGYSIVGVTYSADTFFIENTIFAVFNAHGIENDLSKTEITEKCRIELENYGFNNEENASNKTTYWRNMMIRNLIAAKYLKTLPCWDKTNITSCGGSQGALQATTLAAHDKDVTFLEISIPWFCNLKAERFGFLAGWRPEFAQGLRYFDTVAQAMRVKCPVKIDAGLGDYVCPPSTISVLYNNFKGVKALDFMQSRTHGYIPPEREIRSLRFNPQNPTGEIKKGVYRHFKGNEYEVLGTAFDSATEKEVVIYKALYGENKVWTREKTEFFDYVRVNGIFTPRFEFVK